MVKRRSKLGKQHKIQTKTAKSLILMGMAIAITFVSMLFPAAFTFGGYAGIHYHGFPMGWTGEIAQGPTITSIYNSLQYINYIFGFAIDVIFWFFVAFLLFAVTQIEGRR